jgi:pyruvate formate lyase activating enzyme
MVNSGYIFDIKKFSINDGPGIRTTIFFKGCPLNCSWCHNPESRKMKPEKIRDTSYNWSIYSLSCSPDVIGKFVTSDEVLNEVKKDIPFFEESDGGITFSGGEPLLQVDFLFTLLTRCKSLDINTAVDTSGHTSFSNLLKIYSLTDIFLFDLKILDNERHKNFTGVSNTIILDNLIRLTSLGNKVTVRIPIIPGVNDDEVNISQMVDYLKELNIKQINILPFHNSASAKYRRLNMENKFESIKNLSFEDMEEFKNKFAMTGKPVIVGG